MSSGYYCPKCKAAVAAVAGEFEHPHLDKRTCFCCATCGTIVSYHDDTEKVKI